MRKIISTILCVIVLISGFLFLESCKQDTNKWYKTALSKGYESVADTVINPDIKAYTDLFSPYAVRVTHLRYAADLVDYNVFVFEFTEAWVAETCYKRIQQAHQSDTQPSIELSATVTLVIEVQAGHFIVVGEKIAADEIAYYINN